MRRIQDNNNVMELFESVAEFNAMMDSRQYEWAGEGYRRGTREHYDKKWAGYSRFSDARNDFIHGIQSQVDALNISARGGYNANEPTPYMDVVGYAVDVPSALACLPTCMYNIDLQANVPVVTLFVDVARNCTTTANEIREYGRRVVAYIKALELQGVRVNVYCVECLGTCNERAVLALKVKDSSAPLDVKRLTFPLTSAGMLRIMTFDWYERTTFPTGHYWGYGQAVSRGEDSTVEFIKKCAPSAVYVNQYTDFETLDIMSDARD